MPSRVESVNDDDTWLRCTQLNENVFMYRDGTIPYKPHYSVPAIRLEAEFHYFRSHTFNRTSVAIYITETREGNDNGRYWIYHDSVVAWDEYGRY